jgi:hypothetical protein
VEQDEGTFDGRALGGVAGECIAVPEMLGGVAEREAVLGAGVVSECLLIRNPSICRYLPHERQGPTWERGLARSDRPTELLAM